MRVRVYDKAIDKYYQSEVYALINTGIYCQYVVLMPTGKKAYLKLINEFDTSKGSSYPVNINVITPDVPKDWITRGSPSASIEYKLIPQIMKPDTKLYFYRGYSWLFEDYNVLSSLITGHEIAMDDSEHHASMINSEIEGWNYIDTKEDAQVLLDKLNGFHDSVIKSINYVSGAYVDGEGRMFPLDSIRQVTMVFDSQWSKPVELVFEGVLAMNLRPAQDNYDAIIFGASLFVKDETVYFCNEYLENEPESFDGTWIKAFCLRWRYV